MQLNSHAIMAQIDEILHQWRTLRAASQDHDLSDLDNSKAAAMITSLAAAIDRFAPPGSRYLKLQESVLRDFGPTNGHNLLRLIGILTSLRDDISAGRLSTLTELVHADVFSDFLDMGEHLLQEGYKDAAAVLTGGVLEEHLRKLCSKHAIPTGNGSRHKKADTLNAELAAASAYSKLDQKNVTAWLGLRNDAAHGNYTAYASQQVKLLIQSVRDFITRAPA